MRISDKGLLDKACEICIMGKATHHISRKPDARGESRFESIYCDLNGPIVEDNESQYKYVFGAICDFIQYISLYLMKNKSETPTAFKQLFGYSDSDHASDTSNRKSISGYCFKLNYSLKWKL